ncbi:MAG: tripartite tricarboxylate transporter TctB family protein [Lachnospiraceae bacterium]|nr:tripartite tricarboxylate transporter TctB family protein [Lachnospiraceae bacterium]
MKKTFYFIVAIFFAIFVAGYYYAVFPAINPHETSFWGGAFIIFLILVIVSTVRTIKKDFKNKKPVHIKEIRFLPGISKFFLGLAALMVVIMIGGMVVGFTLFNAKRYASLLKVEEYDFSEDMQESTQVTDIALMDTESARKFGNRKIGSLSDVVSQYEVETDYTQISIRKKPMKVSSLKYASFFKWLNNRKSGIPGYVKVNPVNSEAEYVPLKQGMRYVPSAYFNDNLQRHVQLSYPTKLISGYHFEIDDEGMPFYICPTMTARVGLFDGMDVDGVIVCNPIDGACKFYKKNEIPSWVDCVYSGSLSTKKYDWYGTLSDGFWNSVIGQKGCKVTTDDYGYKIIEDDVWIYTGVTSVTGDQSNIGFILINQRTSEAKYYKVSGAEEHSAMESAQGAVQEKGYKASFPSLINVGGKPTYIMVLKDAAGLVKMYAMVNVEQYNIVATATSQSEVFSKYRKMLLSSGSKDSEGEETLKTEQIRVEEVRFVDTEDGTVVYVKDTEHQVYKQAFKENEELILISEGDTLEVTYEPMENGIHLLTGFQIIESVEKDLVRDDTSQGINLSPDMDDEDFYSERQK